MEGILTGLTDKQETLARTILLAGIAAHGASLTGIVGVHFDGHTAIQRGFVGDHGMQLGKGPLGMTGVGFALLPARFLAMLAFKATLNGSIDRKSTRLNSSHITISYAVF